jgi:hypothetical protein
VGCTRTPSLLRRRPYSWIYLGTTRNIFTWVQTTKVYSGVGGSMLVKVLLQYTATLSFVGLTIVGLVEKDWNFGVGVNLGLVILYIFLYFTPIK